MKVYLVRHGESEVNAGGIRRGADTPLTELGKEQAEDIAKRLTDYKFDKFISSDYLRAKQTSEVIAQYNKLPIEYSNLLIEMVLPSELNGLLKYDPETIRIKNVLWSHFLEGDWHYSDEESPKDLICRAAKALEYLSSFSDSCENILVSTHGNFLRCLTAVALWGDDLDLLTLKKWFEGTATFNAGITVMEYESSRTDGLSRWRLITWNDHAHF